MLCLIVLTEPITLSQLEAQDLLNRQKIQLTRDQDEVIEVQTGGETLD